MNFKRTRTLKVISAVAAVMLGLTMSFTAVPVDAASKNIKEETVYVITDQSGKQDEIIVSDHLINNTKSKTLKDVSSLENIENVKGNEKFKSQKDGTINWEADGNDIYYQGNTNSKTPVKMNIKYYLDGKKVKGEELKGKSGKIKISITYENNRDIDIDGKSVKVPFAAITGMIVENHCFRNISVSSGKVIDDGEKQFIVLMAMPGLKESLDITDVSGISDTVEITGEASDFQMDDMMTVVNNDIFKDIDFDEFSEMDMDDQIDELNKAAKALNEGTLELYEGINTLYDKSTAMTKGVSELNSGAKKLSRATKQAVKGSSELSGGAEALSKSVSEELIPGVENLSSGAKTLASGAAQLAGSIGSVDSYDSSTLVGGAAQLAVGLNGNGTAENPGLKKSYDNVVAYSEGTVDNALGILKTLKENGAVTEEQYDEISTALNQSVANQKAVQSSIGQLAGGAQSLYAGTKAISSGVYGDGTAENPGLLNGTNSVAAGTEQLLGKLKGTEEDTQTLEEGSKALAEGASKLQQGQSQINSGAKELAKGMEQLDSSTGKLIDGIRSLNTGSFKLHRGMKQFYHDGIEKIVNLYNHQIKGKADNAEAVIKAGREYNVFTEKSHDMDGSIKFIYRTEIMSQ